MRHDEPRCGDECNGLLVGVEENPTPLGVETWDVEVDCECACHRGSDDDPADAADDIYTEDSDG